MPSSIWNVDVKKNRKDEMFLAITESKKVVMGEGDDSFGKTFLSLFGIGLLSLIPLGIWFYAAWLQGGQPFMDLMLEENTGRFVGKMSYPSHHNPLWAFRTEQSGEGFRADRQSHSVAAMPGSVPENGKHLS